MKTCIRCHERKSYCKEMCQRCYYATMNGYKTFPEKLIERNYIENGIGILTDKKKNKWFVDIEDFDMCSKYLWSNTEGYAKSNKVGFLHRFLMPEFSKVDHIDRNRSNNRKSNLRNGEDVNNINRTKNGIGISGYRGVHKMRNKWQSTIQYKNTKYHIGTFDTPEEAHIAVIEFSGKINLIEFYK